MIRQMQLSDLKAVVDLEQACFLDPWSEPLWQDILTSSLDTVWIYENDKAFVGAYCNFRIVAGEGELMRIGVHPRLRNQGIAKKLMETLVTFARAQQIREVTLEVRAGNLSAINLYKSYGFAMEAVRKAYYDNPKEDAWIMWNRCV